MNIPPESLVLIPFDWDDVCICICVFICVCICVCILSEFGFEIVFVQILFFYKSVT